MARHVGNTWSRSSPAQQSHADSEPGDKHTVPLKASGSSGTRVTRHQESAARLPGRPGVGVVWTALSAVCGGHVHVTVTAMPVEPALLPPSLWGPRSSHTSARAPTRNRLAGPRPGTRQIAIQPHWMRFLNLLSQSPGAAGGLCLPEFSERGFCGTRQEGNRLDFVTKCSGFQGTREGGSRLWA